MRPDWLFNAGLGFCVVAVITFGGYVLLGIIRDAGTV